MSNLHVMLGSIHVFHNAWIMLYTFVCPVPAWSILYNCKGQLHMDLMQQVPINICYTHSGLMLQWNFLYWVIVIITFFSKCPSCWCNIITLWHLCLNVYIVEFHLLPVPRGLFPRQSRFCVTNLEQWVVDSQWDQQSFQPVLSVGAYTENVASCSFKVIPCVMFM